jgi:hypothetical protein
MRRPTLMPQRSGYPSAGCRSPGRKLIAEGIERGRTEGLRVAIDQVLGVRSVALSEVGRARIVSCADVALLTRWLRQAATAASEADVFAGEPSP